MVTNLQKIAGGEEARECPECHSKKNWKDGFRETKFGLVQRFVCRDCGIRFSAKSNIEFRKNENCQLSAVLKEAKKLDTATETKTVVGEISRNTNGAIIEFLWQLKRQNFKEDTIEAYGYSFECLVHLGVNLFDPQSFIDVMASLSKTEIRKYNLAKAYRCFLNQHGIKAKLPKYRVTRPIPYVPPEEYLDQLIASSNQMMAAFLQTLKESAARPGEAMQLEWDDLDIEGKKLTISHPEKGCNPRIHIVSPKLVRMLLALPRTQTCIFTYKNKRIAGKAFHTVRKRAVVRLGNPELGKISFYTYRYWKATMEYWRTHDFGAVMVLLGHKSLRYVLLYAQLSEVYNIDKGYSVQRSTKSSRSNATH